MLLQRISDKIGRSKTVIINFLHNPTTRVTTKYTEMPNILSKRSESFIFRAVVNKIITP